MRCRPATRVRLCSSLNDFKSADIVFCKVISGTYFYIWKDSGVVFMSLLLLFCLHRAGSDQKTRLDKLQNIIKKLYNSYGTITNEYWPIDSNNKTKG